MVIDIFVGNNFFAKLMNFMKKSFFVYHSLALIMLIYTYFLPWPASFGQSNYGYNFGYGVNQSRVNQIESDIIGLEFYPQGNEIIPGVPDLRGLWSEVDVDGDIYYYFINQSGTAIIMAETTPIGPDNNTWWAIISAGQLSVPDSSGQIGVLTTIPSSSFFVELVYSAFLINSNSILFRLDSCLDKDLERISNLCNRLQIGTTFTITR